MEMTEEEDRCSSEGCDIRRGDIECRVCGVKVTSEEELESTSNKSSTTGSAVVTVLERVWSLIRDNHPELPAIVIVTGSGYIGSPRWGHFRAAGWVGRAEDEGAVTDLQMGEMFIAGETLAKGAPHTLETVLHEAAHVLAKAREIQDTSRQGRWHNAKFRSLAVEMGLMFEGSAVHPRMGYSEMVLTDDVKDRYADLLTELDAAIRLVIDLPTFLKTVEGGSGGEAIHGGRRPRSGESDARSSQLKATCECDPPRIIRASRKTLDGAAIMCNECKVGFEVRD